MYANILDLHRLNYFYDGVKLTLFGNNCTIELTPYIYNNKELIFPRVHFNDHPELGQHLAASDIGIDLTWLFIINFLSLNGISAYCNYTSVILKSNSFPGREQTLNTFNYRIVLV